MLYAIPENIIKLIGNAFLFPVPHHIHRVLCAILWLCVCVCDASKFNEPERYDFVVFMSFVCAQLNV